MTDRDDQWASARDDFRRGVLPLLERDGLAIGKAAYAGNNNALRIIKYYEMLHRSFDPMTLQLMKDAMKEYGVMK